MKKLVLCVIDGLTPAMLERGLEEGRLPALRFLAENGTYAHGVTTFPSVTPVCLSAIATGAGPDVHGIPHLVWYHRQERRMVEYGSSLAATLAAGLRGTVRDSVIEMSRSHLSSEATTVFEALEDAGLVTGAINFTCYRGRARHRIKLPELVRRNRWYEAVDGPKRFYFFNLYESDPTGAPLAVRSRTAGSVDRYAVAVGRWLVTRDGFDFLVYYLPDYDYASHAVGPDAAMAALENADRSIAELFAAAGGSREFLERYAVLVCSDHGQTRVERVVQLERLFGDLELFTPRRSQADRCDICVTASNRAAMIYRLPEARVETRQLVERLEGEPAADVVLFRENGVAVARRERQELRFAPGGGGFRFEGNARVLPEGRYPNGLERAWKALACGSAGEIIVSAAEGYEFADLGGRHHLGGGSHGSLVAGDSIVPMLAAGFEREVFDNGRPSVTDIKALALEHFGVEPPSAAAEVAGAV